MCDECEKKQLEIERLRRDHIGAHRISGDTIKMLEAEIVRLRAEIERLQYEIVNASDHS